MSSSVIFQSTENCLRCAEFAKVQLAAKFRVVFIKLILTSVVDETQIWYSLHIHRSIWCHIREKTAASIYATGCPAWKSSKHGYPSIKLHCIRSGKTVILTNYKCNIAVYTVYGMERQKDIENIKNYTYIKVTSGKYVCHIGPVKYKGFWWWRWSSSSSFHSYHF